MQKKNETLSFASDKIHVVFCGNIGSLRATLPKVLADLRLEDIFVIIWKDELSKAHVKLARLWRFQIVHVNCHYIDRKLIC